MEIVHKLKSPIFFQPSVIVAEMQRSQIEKTKLKFRLYLLGLIFEERGATTAAKRKVSRVPGLSPQEDLGSGVPK